MTLQDQTMDPSDFIKLLTNKMPHILENIFLSLDYESFKECHKVCVAWKDILSRESFRQKAETLLAENGWNLWKASRDGNVEEVKRIISNGMVDVNCKQGYDKTTPLYMAAENGHIEVAKVLLNAGADANTANRKKKKVTALYQAVSYNSKDMVKLLLDRGADPDIGRRHTLNEAVRIGSKEVVQMLLDGGADIDKGDAVGFTPLYYAVACGHKEVVQELLDRGADPCKEDRNGRTPLWGARTAEIREMLTDAEKKRAMALYTSQPCFPTLPY